MCGFVAIYKTGNNLLDPDVLNLMTNLLSHRGPDDYGFSFVGSEGSKQWRTNLPAPINSIGVAFGHRRLSILDLSSEGRQPFASSDGRYWIVYNGEIYNYVEIRYELSERGYRFRTQTDTEVLLTAYEAWGTDCFAKLNGMWALAIWDNEKQTLVISRDRFGVKPLYYSKLNGDWLFASEAKALLAHPEIKSTPNKPAIFDYLLSNLVPAGEDTFFESIKSVEPGSYLCLDSSGATKKRFWDLSCNNHRLITDEDDAIDEFRTLFTSSVQMRLRSDVNVGTTLSGGLDSTSIVRTIVELLEFDESARQVVGPSIQGFNAAYPGHALDESAKVDELCEQFNIRAHKVLPMVVEDVEGLIDDVTYHMEMPFNSSIPMVNMLLMRRARSEGIKVLLNGHGADELFAGYPAAHCSLAVADELRRFRWDRAFSGIRGMTVHQGHSWKSAARISLQHLSLMRWYTNSWFANERHRQPAYRYNQEFMPGHLARIAERDKNQLKGRTELDGALRTQFFRDILPRWLHMEDRISMSASVEARLPFLDFRLVEFAFGLDNSLKVRSGVTKFIIRKAMHQKLPKSIIADRQKYFFPGPDIYWLNGPLKPLLLSKLTEGTPRVTEFIDGEAIRSMVNEYLAGNHKLNRRVWRLLHTEMWMRRFVS